MFELSLKNDNDDLRINSSDEYYMPLVEIKDFNALIDIKKQIWSVWKTCWNVKKY